MKVLLIMPLNHKYGSPNTFKILLEEIHTMPYDIEFAVITGTYGEINRFCDSLGINNYVIYHDYSMYMPMKNKVLEKFKLIYRRIKVGIGYILAIKKIEKILDINSFDVIYAGINRDLLGVFLAKKYKKPLLMHLHEFSKGHFDLDILYKNQVQVMNQYVSQFIAISKAVAKDWGKAGLDSEKITVIYNGVRPNKAKHSALEDADDKLKIVMVGGMYEQKGQKQLISAIGRLNDEYRDKILVDFYGDGKEAYLKELKDLIEKYELVNICTLKGYNQEITNKLADYDVGVVCSKAEGFGLVTVEYMMAGLCPVVSDTGANTEIVEDNKTGLVYRYGNVNDLSSIVKYLLKHPQKKFMLGQQAKNYALTRFNANNFALEILKLLNRVYSNSSIDL